MNTHRTPAPPDVPAPGISTVTTVADLRTAISGLRAAGRRVAFVPTMGALHDGHLSLIRQAGRDDHAVVVSVFVNPTQFAAGEDLSRYPRDLRGDTAKAADAGAALMFAPDAAEVYPEGFATTISVDGPASGLEGAVRPGHFDGVATVVAKLMLMVRPDRVVFGRKDAQQLAVVRRLLNDLHLDDVALVAGDIVREADGVAMSSRNAYLGPDDRAAATALHGGLRAASALAAAGERDGRLLEQAALDAMGADPRVDPEYAALVEPDTFERLDRATVPALLCVAARVGPARLIDNMTIDVPATGAHRAHERRHVPPVTRTMLKSKIHRATVTEADLNYVGSITIDRDLLDAANIHPYEHVHVVDINNGSRFETYTIEGPRGSGMMCVNGAAARLVQPGDLVIVLSYAQYDEGSLKGYEPVVVTVDEHNRRTEDLVADTVPVHWQR